MVNNRTRSIIGVVFLLFFTVLSVNTSLFQIKTPNLFTRASQDGVGINFTSLETPKSNNSVWRWRSDTTASKHIGETITIQYGVYWCKTSSGQVGEGKGSPCAPDLTPTDMVETIIFQERQFVVQNTTFQSTHRSVDCGRIQIDIGGLGGILGGDTYDTGVSCGGSPNPQPTLGATNPPPLSSFFPPAPTSVLDNVRSDQRAIIEIIKAIYLELAGEGGDVEGPGEGSGGGDNGGGGNTPPPNPPAPPPAPDDPITSRDCPLKSSPRVICAGVHSKNPPTPCQHCNASYLETKWRVYCGTGIGTEYGLDVRNANNDKTVYLPKVNGHAVNWQFHNHPSKPSIQTYSGTDEVTQEKYWLQFHHTQTGSGRGGSSQNSAVGAQICTGADCDHLHIQLGSGSSKSGTQWFDAYDYFCH